MELRHLRYFEALARKLSFTRAAEQVHVSQPTLSHQIRQLEDELGTALFYRLGRQVVMTEAGELLLPRVTRALEEINAGITELKGGTRQAQTVIRVGTTPSFNLRLVPLCLSRFLPAHPDVLVRVGELQASEVARLLLAGDLDMGVTFSPANLAGLTFEALYEEEMVLAVSPRHPFATRRRVRMVELHHQPLVQLPHDFTTRQMLDAWFSGVGAEPLVVAEMNAVGPMLEFIKLHPAAAVVSEHLCADVEDLRLVPLESPTPTRTPGILWLQDANRRAMVNAFAAVIREVVVGKQWRRAPPRHGRDVA